MIYGEAEIRNKEKIVDTVWQNDRKAVIEEQEALPVDKEILGQRTI